MLAVAGIEGSSEEAAAIKEGGVSPAQTNASADPRSTVATDDERVLYQIDDMVPGTAVTLGHASLTMAETIDEGVWDHHEKRSRSFFDTAHNAVTSAR